MVYRQALQKAVTKLLCMLQQLRLVLYWAAEVRAVQQASGKPQMHICRQCRMSGAELMHSDHPKDPYLDTGLPLRHAAKLQAHASQLSACRHRAGLGSKQLRPQPLRQCRRIVQLRGLYLG